MTTETKKTLRDVAEILERAGWTDRSINIGGNVTNSMVAQTINKSSNIVQQQAPGKQKELLEALQRDVQQLLERLPADKHDKAPKVARDLTVLIEQATSPEPERDWYSLSAKGLLEAAQWVRDLSGAIAETILNLGKAIWPNFELPAVK